MTGVTEPFEQHHLGGDDLRAVLPGAVERGGPVGRAAGAYRVRRHGDAVPAGEQVEDGLQDADMCLDAGDDDLTGGSARAGKQQGG